MGNTNSLNYKRVLVPFSEEQLAKVFNNYDRDRDGKLTKGELKEAFNYLGCRCSNFRADEAFRAADINRDGVISWEEMSNLVVYAKGFNYTLG